MYNIIRKFWLGDSTDPSHVQMTRFTYLLSYILYTPFWGIYNMLPFILYKDLHATPWQIAMLITLKPVVSIFSLYWSSHVSQRPDRLKKNIVIAGVLGNLPFFFYPFVDNVWFFVITSASFMLLARGVVPAWMEILKINIPTQSRSKAFAYGSSVCYLLSGVFPILFGWLMDEHLQVWRWIFPVTALLSMSTILLQIRLPTPPLQNIVPPDNKPSLIHHLVHPWKKSWELLRQRPDFAWYQGGIMISGFGVMLWQPALPVFFMDGLNLSYTELATALAFFKGIGYATSSPMWANYFNRSMIYRFCGYVAMLFCVFPLLLIAAKWDLLWLYAAYVLYGVTQSASEMSWSLSGPAFSRDQEDSSSFTSINVLMVGLRGCIAPPLGSYLLVYGGSQVDMVLGSILCGVGAVYMFVCASRFAQRKKLSVNL